MSAPARQPARATRVRCAARHRARAAGIGTVARRCSAVLREAIAAAKAARVTSLLTLAVVGVLCAVVILTTGRTVGAQNAIIASIDSASTRSIVVRAPVEAGLDTDVLTRLANASAVSNAIAFGPAEDVTNAAFAGGQRVALRTMYTLNPAAPTSPDARQSGAAPAPVSAATTPPPGAARERTALASPDALRVLGLPDSVGALRAVETGADVDVTASLAMPDYLSFLAPLVVAPSAIADSEPQPVTVLVVVAATSDQLEAVTALVESVLGVSSRDKVTVDTSARLAELRASVGSQLSDFSRSLTLLVFAVGGGCVAAILFGLVLLRRRDFGRRRALGASRALIVGLLCCQVTVLGAAGAASGCTASALALIIMGDPLPTPAFVLAVALLAVVTAGVASLAPAVVASRRDPLRELRVA